VDIVRAPQARGVTFADLVVGTAYCTGPGDNEIYLCVEVKDTAARTPFCSMVKRLVRLKDCSLWSTHDFSNTPQFAPVQCRVVIE
jgi:hypothetical protein